MEGEMIDEESAFNWSGYGLSKWIAELYVRKYAPIPFFFGPTNIFNIL